MRALPTHRQASENDPIISGSRHKCVAWCQRLPQPHFPPLLQITINVTSCALLLTYSGALLTGTTHSAAQFLHLLPADDTASTLSAMPKTAFSGFPLAVSTHEVEEAPGHWLFGQLPLTDEEADDSLPVEEFPWLKQETRHGHALAPQFWLSMVAVSAILSVLFGTKKQQRHRLLEPFMLQDIPRSPCAPLAMLAVTGVSVPATIIGDGPLEQQLATTNTDSQSPDILLNADQWVGSDGLEVGPVLFCGIIDLLDAAIESTPGPRRADLVIFHNSVLDPILDRYVLQLTPTNIGAATQCLVDLAIGEDGKLFDRHPEGLTVVSGRHADQVVQRLASIGISCEIKDEVTFRAIMLQNLIWQSAFSLVGTKFRLKTIGEVEQQRPNEVSQLIVELLTAVRAANPNVPLDGDDVVVDYAHLVYAPKYADGPASLQGFPHRNGYFWDMSQKAIAASRSDPCPQHTMWVEDCGIPGVESLERTDGLTARVMATNARQMDPAATDVENAEEAPLIPMDELVGAFSGKTDRELAEALRNDIQRFKEKSAGLEPEEPSASSLKTSLENLASTLGIVLSYNFLIIIAFFLWFVAAVVSTYGFKNDFLLLAFQSKWEIIILPLLSTHMALTFISKGIEVAAEKLD